MLSHECKKLVAKEVRINFLRLRRHLGLLLTLTLLGCSSDNEICTHNSDLKFRYQNANYTFFFCEPKYMKIRGLTTKFTVLHFRMHLCGLAQKYLKKCRFTRKYVVVREEGISELFGNVKFFVLTTSAFIFCHLPTARRRSFFDPLPRALQRRPLRGGRT